jgi:hypothetical protein
VPLPLDRFLRYADLTAVLQTLAAEHPGLVELASYGRSYEGRDLWIVTVTDRSTGAHHDRPAHWVDANIHATEVTGGVAALALLEHLVTGFGSDPQVTEALRTRTFYVVPRVNPDGVEAALADQPTYLRSSVRPWPWRDAWRKPGLHVEDIDGNGRLRTMRIPDPNGAWVGHADEPRLMVPRPVGWLPTDGPCYRMLAEGTLQDHDGFTVPTPRAPQGLDLNRNFPAGWGTSVPGSGDHPGSEPEIAALIAAIVARPNICGTNAFHTSGGVLLRPSSTRSDGDLPPVDVWAWKHLGAKGTELTGYPVHSVFEDFTWDKSETMSGAADDWAYEHLGVFSWTTEFWDAAAHVGAGRLDPKWWYTGPTVEQELAVLRWADEHHPGLMYGEWTAFQHPQLGAVEIGGWDALLSWTNPPPALLEQEVRPHAAFAVHQAMASPRLEILLADAEAVGEGVWRVRAGVANTGWLPTDVTAWARKHHLVLPVTAEVLLPDGASVLGGPARVELGQLEGALAARLGGGNDGTPDRALATWLVRAPAGTEVTIEARHPRSGTTRTTLPLR